MTLLCDDLVQYLSIMTSLYFQGETGKEARKWFTRRGVILLCVKCTFTKGNPDHSARCVPGQFAELLNQETIVRGWQVGWASCPLELPPLVQPDLVGAPLVSGSWECF